MLVVLELGCEWNPLETLKLFRNTESLHWPNCRLSVPCELGGVCVNSPFLLLSFEMSQSVCVYGVHSFPIGKWKCLFNRLLKHSHKQQTVIVGLLQIKESRQSGRAGSPTDRWTYTYSVVHLHFVWGVYIFSAITSCHLVPLPGNDCETNNYTRAIVKQQFRKQECFHGNERIQK